MTAIPTFDTVDWPQADPIAAERIVDGAPEASTTVLHQDERCEVGLWRVTPGEFTTHHRGYVEFITVLSGRGRLVHDNGETVELGPGAVTVLPDGWTGRWQIEETLVKSYAVAPTSVADR